MQKYLFVFVTICIVIIYFIEPVKAQWGCDSGCTGGQVCAEFPSGSSINFDATASSYSGCHASPSFPSVSASLYGDSYCTDNILDGMSSSTTCSTPVIWDGNNSTWFNWLTGEVEVNNNSVCLMPGDEKTDAQFYAQCTTTSTPNDPVSTLPPSIITDDDFYWTDGDVFKMRDFHMEATVDCLSEYQTIATDVAYELSSPNYPSIYDDTGGYDHTWIITQPGAYQMAVHFDYFNTPYPVDFIEILDSNNYLLQTYTGDIPDLTTVKAMGDTIKVRFYVSDDGANNDDQGWHIDKYVYYTANTSEPMTVVPKVNLYIDNNYSSYATQWNGSYSLGRTIDATDEYSWIEVRYLENIINNINSGIDYDAINNNTYYYRIGHGCYGCRSRSSEIIAVPVYCAEPVNNEPQINSGFNLKVEKENDNKVVLNWIRVNNAVQYYIERNNQAIYSTSPWTNYRLSYMYGGDISQANVEVFNTYFINYQTETNFIDDDIDLSSGSDSVTYRVYAVVPQDFIIGDEYGPWDGSYTWNSRYPWDHNLVLSEEVIVHADGSIEETDTDPIDEGGSGTATCNQTCIVDGDCTSGLSCVSNMCRKTECTTSSNCNCSFLPSETSSLTDHQSNTIANQPITTTILYDIRTDQIINDGSIKIVFPNGYVFGTLTSTDVTVEGGNVTWGTPVIDSGNRTVVVPFTGELSKDDDRITINIGGVNYLTNPMGSGTYLIALTSYDSSDGTGPIIDQAEDNIEIQDASDAGKGTLSDTLSVSLPGNDSRHTIRYNISQTARSITNGSLKVTLDSEFDMSGITDSDITIIGGDVTWSSDKIIYGAGAQIGWLQSLFNMVANAQGENSIVFNFTGTLDGTDEMITIIIGDDNYISNPINTGSFSVDLTTYESANASGNIIENLLAKVFINSGVTVTATVPSSLTFTVLPVNSAQPVNGTTTNVDSSSNLINFGVIEPSQTKVAAQDLQVATNAADGFVVTLQSLNNFTSTRGDSISPYTGTDTLPILWSSPSGGAVHGYFGYTTDDYTLSNVEYDRFDSNMWAGTTMTASEVMYHNGPTNSIGQGQGTTRVGYQLEIDNLQPAGIYSTDLMYICTATF